jgi:isoleucyl-tRNA synthetase
VLACLVAPIMPHTAEEVWSFLPIGPTRRASVHLVDWPNPDPVFDDPDLAARFGRLLGIRELALVAIEGLRKIKTIGSAQEASLTIHANADDAAFVRSNLELLRDLCIVSEVHVKVNDAQSTINVAADRSPYPKCERCWNHRSTVGQNPEHPTLCERCVRVLTSESDGA